MLGGAVLGAFEWGGTAAGAEPIASAMLGEGAMSVVINESISMACAMQGEFAGVDNLSAFGVGDLSEVMRRPYVNRSFRRGPHDL